MAQTHSLDLEASSSQYASIADASQTGLDITGDLTIEAWVKFESLPTSGNYAPLVVKWADAGNQRGYAFNYYNNAGTYRFNFQYSSSGADDDFGFANHTLLAGVWYHIALTFNASASEAKFYVNGLLIGTDAGTLTSIFNNTAAFRVGHFADAADYFDGLIKDVRIFNDVRTASEIASDARTQNVSDANLKGEWNFNNAYTDSSGNGNTLSASGSPVFSTDVPWTAPTSVSGSNALTTNLVSYWPLDEASGNRVDSHGSNTLTDNNTVASAAGKQANAADFEAANSESLSISDGTQSGLDLTGDLSFSVWGNIESAPTGKYAIVTKQAGSNESYQFGYRDDSGKKLFFVNSSGGSGATEDYFDIARDLGTATWHHLVLTFNASAARASFYVDGVLVHTAADTNTSIFNGNAAFAVGSSSSGSADFFDGLLDELAVYSRALHYGDVLDLYNAGSAIPYQASQTTSHALDALIKKVVTATHATDALLKKSLTATHTLAALLKKSVAATHSLDAYLRLPTPTITHTISAYLLKERLRLEKTILARVSLPNGTYLTAWKNIDFRGYTKQLNGGPGECIIDYAVPFDYDGADLREGNEVELVISDADTQLTDIEDGTFGARRIYRGYISLIERNIDANSEHVRVHLLGYYTLLSLDVLKNGSQTTLYSHDTSGLTTSSGSQAAADIGLVARAVIDRFIAEHGAGKVFYKSEDVPDTGTTATYAFNQKTYREALDALKSLAPANVYWYVDETGKFKFKAPSSSTDHRFVFGRHFSKVQVERSLEKVRNVVLIWNGASVYKQYTDAASIGLYGRRTERINDYGISNSNAADAAGTKFLAENKDPGLKLVCTIIDNNNAQGLGYDIESIQPGDTCSLSGFSSTLSDIFRDNMLITRVYYMLDAVEIEVELTKSGLVDTQARHSRELADIGSGGLGVPATYS